MSEIIDVKTSLLTLESKAQGHVSLSALRGGTFTLPKKLFVSSASDDEYSRVPSLSFLIVHQSPGTKQRRILFDLGLRRDTTKYTSQIQGHLYNRLPLDPLPDVRQSLLDGGLDPGGIDEVILSHVHWDHIGTPLDYPQAQFFVGAGSLGLLKEGSGGHMSHSNFQHDLFDHLKVVEFSDPRAVKSGWHITGGLTNEARRLSPTASFYDAPVSGGTLGAEAASLTIMVGCAEDTRDAQYQLLIGLLGYMGKNIIACGGPGMGLTAKFCNNYCSGLISIATAEAMNIGIRSGIDPRLLARVFASSTAQSTVCDKWNPVPGLCPDAPSSKGYEGGFKVQLMAKDFGLAVSAAEEVGATLLLGDAGLAGYNGASQDPRCRDLDSRVVFRFIGGREDWDKA
ncbi:uncharacterized protein DNG_06885 [Cephalotrichum gorgonifer]|uniref:3-hydroxyisobutyrate dehydrogenase n=1 Tax=Cephalotrichum gorgonifer TaxID=2041049 RepID=A0AAE8SXQ7_9PEZI|nr:uncharacterized protein DNG_06885 [Cephalotrichum gorgonifer]